MEIANWRYDSSSALNPQKYLNSAPADRTSDKFSSRWSRARQATKRLKFEWAIGDNTRIDLKVGEDFVTNRRLVFKSIG